jgi:hypothetical protein
MHLGVVLIESLFHGLFAGKLSDELTFQEKYKSETNSQRIQGYKINQVHDTCAFYEEKFAITLAYHAVYLQMVKNLFLYDILDD